MWETLFCVVSNCESWIINSGGGVKCARAVKSETFNQHFILFDLQRVVFSSDWASAVNQESLFLILLEFLFLVVAALASVDTVAISWCLSIHRSEYDSPQVYFLFTINAVMAALGGGYWVALSCEHRSRWTRLHSQGRRANDGGLRRYERGLIDSFDKTPSARNNLIHLPVNQDCPRRVHPIDPISGQQETQEIQPLGGWGARASVGSQLAERFRKTTAHQRRQRSIYALV